jgi:hypothetical protein
MHEIIIYSLSIKITVVYKYIDCISITNNIHNISHALNDILHHEINRSALIY